MTIRDEVCNLIATYCHALDDGRTDDLLATFTADATVEFPGMGTHTGADALRAVYSKWTPRGPQRHVVTNTHVKEDGDGARATATSDFVFMTKGDAGWAVQLVGRYDDELVDDNGTWRFARRTATFL